MENVLGRTMWVLNSVSGELLVRGDVELDEKYALPPWDEFVKVIQEVCFESGVTSICRDAFCSCSLLRRVDLPRSLLRIGDSAFSYCEALRHIFIPESVEEISPTSFEYNSALESIELSPRNPHFELIDEVLFDKAESCIILCSPHKTGHYDIPSTVKDICSGAFMCIFLTSITVPEGITTIKERAFAFNDLLVSVKLPESLKVIETSAFESCSRLSSITLPEGLTAIGNYAFFECDSLTSVFIPKNVKSMGILVFQKCGAFESIEVDEENQHFASKDGVLFNKDMTHLITYPFSKVGAYVVPESVKVIERFAFQSTAISAVSLPEGLTTIEKHVFGWCEHLDDVYIPDSVEYLGRKVFDGCRKLVSVSIPNHLQMKKVKYVESVEIIRREPN